MNPFNGDIYIGEVIKKLRDKYALTYAIETGTQFGYTTRYLSELFDKVISIEIDIHSHLLAADYLRDTNVELIHGDSAIEMQWIKKVNHPVLFYLDAHGSYEPNPLIEELKQAGRITNNPIIIIHDFKVPDKALGYDTYNGQPYTIEWIKPVLDEIYSQGYIYNYNSQATGAMRGAIFIEPKRITT